MKKSAYFSDVLFAFCLAFLCTLCLFRYLGIALFLSLLLSVVCGALVGLAIAAILQSKRKTLRLKKSDEEQKRRLLLHLALLSEEQRTRFFLRVFAQEQGGVTRMGKLRVASPSAIYRLCFDFAPVTADAVATFARIKTNKEKFLLCHKIEEEAATLCHTLGIRLQTGDDVYALVKERDAFPPQYLGELAPQDKKKRLFHLCFSKSNSRRFLTGGALILLTAFLTPFPYYYLIFGGILLLVALCIRIFGFR